MVFWRAWLCFSLLLDKRLGLTAFDKPEGLGNGQFSRDGQQVI